jgi:hypothetical protein
MTDEQDLLRRAFAAYYRSGAREGLTEQQINIPASTSYVTEHDGKAYVVLENVNGVLAVYRVRNDGMLKGLRRWPSEVEHA